MNVLALLTVGVVALDASLLATGAISVWAASVIFLVVELPLGVGSVAAAIRRYRILRREVSKAEAWAVLSEQHPALRVAGAEARSWASLLRVVLRRPQVPPGYSAVRVAPGGLAVPMAFAGVGLVEVVVVHLVVGPLWSRVVLDVLGLYSVLVLVGLGTIRLAYPHLLGEGQLVLRAGGARCAVIPLGTVIEAHSRRCLSPTFPSFVDEPSGTVAFAGQDGTNIEFATSVPVAVSLRSMPWSRSRTRTCTCFRLEVDEPRQFVDRLRSEASAQPTTSGPAPRYARWGSNRPGGVHREAPRDDRAECADTGVLPAVPGIESPRPPAPPPHHRRTREEDLQP